MLPAFSTCCEELVSRWAAESLGSELAAVSGENGIGLSEPVAPDRDDRTTTAPDHGAVNGCPRGWLAEPVAIGVGAERPDDQ